MRAGTVTHTVNLGSGPTAKVGVTTGGVASSERRKKGNATNGDHPLYKLRWKQQKPHTRFLWSTDIRRSSRETVPRSLLSTFMSELATELGIYKEGDES